MKLLPFYSIADGVELYLGIRKELLFRYAKDAQISLAVPLHSLLVSSFNNLLHEKYDIHHFKKFGDYRFIYLHQNIISLNEESFLSSGKIPARFAANFERSPIGHPDNGSFKDTFTADFGSEFYKKAWHENDGDVLCDVFLTCEAVQYSPVNELFTYLRDQDNPKDQDNLKLHMQAIKQNENKKEIESVNKYEALVKVIASMGLNPEALNLSGIKGQYPNRGDIFKVCQKKYPKLFSMSKKSFTAKHGVFGRAVEQGYIKWVQK